MAGGALVDNGSVRNFDGEITASVVITCIVAASGGLLFGYDIGISGGVTTMESFLKKFFPSVLDKMASTSRNVYCVYDSQIITAFTSSLYIAGLVSSLAASRFITNIGRQATILLGGVTFFIGSAINVTAVNVVMLILGRIMLGFGVGLTNQATPLYLSEVAPPKWRGAFSTGFQFFIGIGVLAANIINYFTAQISSWGWRLSLGLAAVPALLMTTGAFLIPDTPSSLIRRGKHDQARDALQRVRGYHVDINSELQELKQSLTAEKLFKKKEEDPFKLIIRRRYRPHLVMAIAIPFFQQMTGINIIAFYAPILFNSLGLGSDTSLIAAIILGAVNLSSIIVSTFVVDRYGRRFLFLQGGIQMLIFEVAVACILAVNIGASGDTPLSKTQSIIALMMLCIYSAGFGWSWGPLSWLLPSEIFPMEIRPAGQSISTSINFATTFVLAQTFLTMLCHFKYGAFLFYAGWIATMTLFIALFLPETKGIPLDSMNKVWEQHWYWRNFLNVDNVESVQ